MKRRRHSGEFGTNMGTEIGVVWPEAKEAKECIQPPEAGRGEEGSSARASGGSMYGLANTLVSDFRF